jgi:hypothetical protein
MSANGDCGCGCGGGGSVMTTALTQVAGGALADPVGGGLVRPRFFTGQLLATEDLQQLIDWVAAKDRLHKRLLVGDGVVCGLQVACAPCGGGHVVVRPGYAIDCCGNDLSLPCEQELDVNAMVRLLLAEQRGADCGDPCPPATTKDGREPAGTPVTRRYALYICHVETLTDLLAPYATDEPCDAEGCEPSRIREGVRFELRCVEPHKEPDDIVARLNGCLEGLVDINRRGRRNPVVAALIESAPPAVARFRAEATAPVVEEDAETLQQALDGLRKVAATAGEPSADEVRAALDQLRAVAGVAARVNALGDAARAAALKDVAGLETAFDAAPKVVDEAVKRLEPSVDKALPDEVERVAAHALLTAAPRLLGGRLSEQDIATFLSQHGVFIDAELLRLLREDQARLREWLLSRLRRIRLTTDCRLLADVEAIEPSAEDPGGEGGEGILRTLDSRLALEQALKRYAAECVCGTLLPPCPDCTDPCVPLAVIEVQECDVVHVCNLERRIALTGSALSYWLPMERLMGLLDQVCCELPRAAVRKREPAPAVPPPVSVSPLFRRVQASSLLGERAESLVDGVGLGTVAARRIGQISDNVAEIVQPPRVRGDEAVIARATEPLRVQLDEQDKTLASLRMELGKLRKRSAELEKRVARMGGS